MKNIELITKTKDLGIELLRFLLCLWIVVYHCTNIKKEHLKFFGRLFHVPTFFLISFYFYYPIFSKRKISKIISRFIRLFIPYIIWPIIILILNNILVKTVSFGQPGIQRILTFEDFFIQILVGNSFHRIFWFQFNLIAFSLFYTIVAFISKKYLLEILSLFGVISLYLNLSEINYKYFLFTKFGYSVGTLMELMPLTIIGCIYSSYNMINKIKLLNIYFRIILFIFIYFLFKYDICIRIIGFRYPEVILNSIASTILFFSFSSLNLNIFIIDKVVISITEYTGGIYYIHLMIRDYFQKYISFFSNRTYFSSFMIYFICFIFCFFGNILFKKNKLKYLFI